MLEELLESVGLSEKESRMYLTLLQHGKRPTTFFAKRGGFNRGTAYVVLHALLEKGLASKSITKGVQMFAPIDPDKLKEELSFKEDELKSTRKAIDKCLPELRALMSQRPGHTRIQFLEGRSGAQRVLKETIAAQDKLLRAFLSIKDIADATGHEFFNEYTGERVKRGYTLHVIRTRVKDELAAKSDKFAHQYRTAKRDRRAVRYIPDEFAFPISIYAFDDKLGVISSKDENFSLLIESKELCAFFKTLFEIVWKLSA